MSKKELDYHAVLTVYDLPSFTKRRKVAVAKWLKKLANEIEKEDGRIFAKIYKAKLMK